MSANSEQVERLQAAAYLNGLERDEANDRLEQIAELVREAMGNVALTRSQMSQLQEIQRLARPAKLEASS